MPTIGDAFVDFHANTDSVEPETRRGIQKAAEDIENDDLKKIGKDWGDATADAMGDELERQGPALAKSVEKGIGKKKVKTKVTVEIDKDNNVVRRWVSTITDEIEDAVKTAAGGGGRGPFGRIGAAISDAIGAGFNVSGKSPLIAALIPLIGVIVGLVAAAIQAIGSLVALLITIPALIGAIVGQVAILVVAFDGIGKAVQGAFAAKNARELNEALKDLTPSAQGFVKQLLQARGYMQQIKFLAQENFFKALGDTFAQVNTALGARFVFGVSVLATSLGNLFRQLGLFFASPTFRDFVDKVIPSTARFLAKFGPSFVTFLEGLFALTTAAIPFLDKFGDILGGNLASLGILFSDIANDPSFQNWLSDMVDTLGSTIELLGQVIQFIAVFMAQLNEAGGVEIIDALSDAFQLLTFVLASDTGQKAMEALVHISILSIQAFTGLLIIITAIFALLEVVAEFFRHDFLPLLETIGKVVVLGLAIVAGAIAGFFDMLRTKIREFFGYTDNVMATVGTRIGAVFVALRTKVATTWASIVAEVRAIPGRIVSALGNLKNLLLQAGRNIIEGLINGIREKLGPLGSIMGFVAGVVGDHIPHSPAKKGPLSGSGDPFYSGQEVVKRFAAGMMMESPTLNAASSEATSNIVFGPNSIRVGFDGVVPTNSQARSTGSAVGSGIQAQLAARDTRLAVRTL